MDLTAYAVEAAIEANHWFFVGRRRLFAGEIRRMALPPDAAVLDTGTSTGSNLRLCSELGFSAVEGLDLSPEAIRFCRDKGLGTVRQGDICAMPFADGHFDLVLATDVIEHVDDDLLALREIVRVLRPGGRTLITVPAFPTLWGHQDIIGQHKRRYRLTGLADKVRSAGLTLDTAYHMNFLLFVPIWLARHLIRWLGLRLRNENEINTPALNQILTWVFQLDVTVAPWLRPPFGVSLVLVATKPRAGTEPQRLAKANN